LWDSADAEFDRSGLAAMGEYLLGSKSAAGANACVVHRVHLGVMSRICWLIGLTSRARQLGFLSRTERTTVWMARWGGSGAWLNAWLVVLLDRWLDGASGESGAMPSLAAHPLGHSTAGATAAAAAAGLSGMEEMRVWAMWDKVLPLQHNCHYSSTATAAYDLTLQQPLTA
jgi:hypothetical protein